MNNEAVGYFHSLTLPATRGDTANINIQVILNRHKMYKETTIRNFNSYLKQALAWSNDKDNDIVIYRGQSESDKYNLIPGIARTPKDPKKYSVKHIQKVEDEMLEEFRRTCDNNIAIKNIEKEEILDILSLAQHYGLPTRLLDWSSNPLAALYFAVKEISEEKSGGNFCVWAYCIKRNDKRLIYKSNHIYRKKTLKELNEEKEILVFKPKLVTERIHFQAGWFTVHPCDNDKGFVPLEEIPFFQKDLAKLIIPKSKAEEFRKMLDTFHINSSTMFPDLTGKATHIRWKIMKDYADFKNVDSE